MELISWNVNGLRSALQKGFLEFLDSRKPEVLCLQESRVLPEQIELPWSDYHTFWNPAEKKGYSGTMVLSKTEPLSVYTGLGIPEHDREGRVLHVEYEKFVLINVYTPNSGDGLKRLDYRMEWDRIFREFTGKLRKKKPVVICGDLNVAHTEIDLRHPDRNRENAGFTDEEREGLSALLDSGYLDTFRHLNPDARERYSWWSFRAGARKNNAGWRIDYFLLDRRLEKNLKNADILDHVYGSDHCPVSLELKI